MRGEVRIVQRRLREAGANVREAGGSVAQAGAAGAEAAREAAGMAGERIGQAAAAARGRVQDVVQTAGERAQETAQAVGERAAETVTVAQNVAGAAVERVQETAEAARDRVAQTAVDVGRTAVGIGVQLLGLPELMRDASRRGVELAEEVGSRAVVSMIHAGTRVLNAAADYVGELAPRRRVDRQALHRLIIDQLGWANLGTEAYDRAAADVADDGVRVRLVRCKLQTLRHGEVLMQLLRDLGGQVPAEERVPPPPVAGDGARGPAAARQGLAHALTFAVQNAEGWRALSQIGTWAEPDSVADAVGRATGTVGREPEEQVEFVRESLLRTSIESVFA
jgi:hypothetical protein